MDQVSLPDQIKGQSHGDIVAPQSALLGAPNRAVYVILLSEASNFWTLRGWEVTLKWRRHRLSCAKTTKDIENSKGDGRHHEEVRRDQLLRVDIQECTPGLRRRFSPTNHVLGHGGL